MVFGGMVSGVCTSLKSMYKLKLNDKLLYQDNIDKDKDSMKCELMKTELPVAMSAIGYCKIDIEKNYSWILIIGGGLMENSKTKCYYDHMFVYDIINNKFYKLNETIDSQLAGVSCVYDNINGNIHIMGGSRTINNVTTECKKHYYFNIGMKGNKQYKIINPIKHREIVWKTLMLVSAEYIVNANKNDTEFSIPIEIWHIIFDMIDDGLLLPLLVKKPYADK